MYSRQQLAVVLVDCDWSESRAHEALFALLRHVQKGDCSYDPCDCAQFASLLAVDDYLYRVWHDQCIIVNKGYPPIDYGFADVAESDLDRAVQSAGEVHKHQSHSESAQEEEKEGESVSSGSISGSESNPNFGESGSNTKSESNPKFSE